MIKRNGLFLPDGRLVFQNIFKAQVIRENKIISELVGHNLVTTEGKNHALDVIFGGGSQVDPWYIGLVDNSPSPSFNAADTLASHAGWAEITTELSTIRLAWTDAAASAGSKGTTTTSDFSITGTTTVNGLFVCSVATGTAGTLFSAGSFSATQDLINGDTFRVSYTVNT